MNAFFVLMHINGQKLEIQQSVYLVEADYQPKDKTELGAQTELLAYAYRDVLGISRPGTTGDISGSKNYFVVLDSLVNRSRLTSMIQRTRSRQSADKT